MKVYEAKKIIENIEECQRAMKALHKLEEERYFKDCTEYADEYLEAYKQLLIDKSKQAMHLQEDYLMPLMKFTEKDLRQILSNASVRHTIASQGIALDKLINDEDEYVRNIVARQGYGLDVLMNDKDELVRCAVARQGYGLDILINDKNLIVRQVVKDYLKDNYLTLEQWMENKKER